MSVQKLFLLIVLGVCAAAGSPAQQPGCESTVPANAQREVRQLEQHWLDVENDPSALEPILADDFLHVLPVGMITKDEQLEFMRKHPAPQGGERHFEELRVRVYGTTAIANGVVVESHDGAVLKTAFTDVFAYRNGRWQAVNAQELPLGGPR